MNSTYGFWSMFPDHDYDYKLKLRLNIKGKNFYWGSTRILVRYFRLGLTAQNYFVWIILRQLEISSWHGHSFAVLDYGIRITIIDITL